MEIRASIVGGVLHCGISVAVWSLSTFLVHEGGLGLLAYLAAFYGGLLAGSIADITGIPEGGVIGFFSGVGGGILAGSSIATIYGLYIGLPLEGLVEIPGFSLVIIAAYMPSRIIEQLGPGVLFGPVGGLLGATLKLRFQRPDEERLFGSSIRVVDKAQQ